jgi:hypothetical protein
MQCGQDLGFGRMNHFVRVDEEIDSGQLQSKTGVSPLSTGHPPFPVSALHIHFHTSILP